MAESRHRRETPARPRLRAALAAASLAGAVTGSAVVLGVAGEDLRDAVPAASAVQATVAGSETGRRPVPTIARQRVVSRSESRLKAPSARRNRSLAAAATARALREANAKRWTSELLNVWSQPGDAGRKVGLLDPLTRVLVTGRSAFGRDEVVVDGRSRWVTSGYLVRHKPLEEKVEPASEAVEREVSPTCSNGSSVPAGVSPNIVAVHAAVCAAFPEITSYGTLRSDGEHAQGIAIDIMVSGARGWEVADFVRANYAELGVSYAIHAQNIWSVERAGEGWRGMEDRGSVTANHFDHVHVTTY